MYLKNASMLFFTLSANGYGFWLSNKLLFFIIPQGAKKLLPVKFRSLKKKLPGQNRTPFYSINLVTP